MIHRFNLEIRIECVMRLFITGYQSNIVTHVVLGIWVLVFYMNRKHVRYFCR